jgi:hypothetical protein
MLAMFVHELVLVCSDVRHNTSQQSQLALLVRKPADSALSKAGGFR